MKVVLAEQLDPRLGRQVVHDPRSREFPRAGSPVDPSSWRTRTLRTYDPRPNPNQPNGCCTGVSMCVQGNTAGVASVSRRLTMADAQAVYTLATSIDPFPGQMPDQDTGSSGLAAAKAARRLGLLTGSYRWLFRGADEVVQAVMDGQPVSVGTWWYDGAFTMIREAHPLPRIEPTGRKVGGHQWTIRGFDLPTDSLIGRCWWGEFRDVRIRRSHLADLLADDGDAHIAAA